MESEKLLEKVPAPVTAAVSIIGLSFMFGLALFELSEQVPIARPAREIDTAIFGALGFFLLRSVYRGDFRRDGRSDRAQNSACPLQLDEGRATAAAVRVRGICEAAQDA